MSVDPDMVRDALHAADAGWAEALGPLIEQAREKLAAYQQAEAANLGDYMVGRHRDAAGRAWGELAAARRALEDGRQAADQARRDAIAAALAPEEPA